MFEDSLLESGGRLKTNRGLTTTISVVFQVGLIGILVLLPLIFTDALPKQQLMTFLVAPPPPPPPPPPAAAPVKVVKVIQTDIVNGALRTPTKIPEKVQMIKEEEAPAPVMSTGGVVGGVPGGVPGGSMGGVIGGIISSTPMAVPKVAAPQRVRVSSGFPQAFSAQGAARLSSLGAPSPYSGQGSVASCDQQRRFHREPTPHQRAPDAYTSRHGCRKAVEVQAVFAEWRTRRSGDAG